MKPGAPPLSLLLVVISIVNAALVVVIAVGYSYDATSTLEAAVSMVVLVAAAGFLWIQHRRSSERGSSSSIRHAIQVGLVLGAAWAVEIGINSFVAPPLRARDIIDDLFWTSIALAILGCALRAAYRTDSVGRGFEVGAWSGLVSGLVACSAARGRRYGHREMGPGEAQSVSSPRWATALTAAVAGRDSAG